MKIATILPIAHLALERGNDYHLCLAHLMKEERYASFFSKQAGEGMMVMADNGVVEMGEAMGMEDLLLIACPSGISEVILPDAICDMTTTLRLSADALGVWEAMRRRLPIGLGLMAVPQGSTADEWIRCTREFIKWPVRAIGISKFVSCFFPSRVQALAMVPELISSDKDIHLLGCPGDPHEIHMVERAFPGRIRGVDSGIAFAYTQANRFLGDRGPRPEARLDFSANLDQALLLRNVQWWRSRCRGLTI